MISRRILAAVALLCMVVPAHAQKSKSTLTSEINSNWPDQNSGTITPALLRSTVIDIVNSYVDWLTCTGTGGVVYWSGGTPTCLAAASNGNILALAAGIPAWTSTLSATAITGTLSVSQGGTGLATIAAHGVMIGEGTGNVAVVAGNGGNSSLPLISQGASLDPIYSGINAAVVTSGNFSISVLSTAPTGGVGYTTGAGGAVTQITSRATGVTLNTVTGAITLLTAAGSATPATFTVTDSAVAATDVVHVSQKSGSNLYEIFVTAVAAGSFNITFFTTGGTTSDAPVFNFAVIKGSAS